MANFLSIQQFKDAVADDYQVLVTIHKRWHGKRSMPAFVRGLATACIVGGLYNISCEIVLN
eukprot:5800912-Amphidinium_carterae.1